MAAEKDFFSAVYFVSETWFDECFIRCYNRKAIFSLKVIVTLRLFSTAMLLLSCFERNLYFLCCLRNTLRSQINGEVLISRGLEICVKYNKPGVRISGYLENG